MDELFSSVDNLSGVSTTERVNPADRSNKDKKKNGFSDVLKEKMKEKLDKEKDLLILQHEESEKEEEQDEKKDDQQDEQKHEDDTNQDSSAEHIDLKA